MIHGLKTVPRGDRFMYSFKNELKKFQESSIISQSDRTRVLMKVSFTYEFTCLKITCFQIKGDGYDLANTSQRTHSSNASRQVANLGQIKSYLRNSDPISKIAAISRDSTYSQLRENVQIKIAASLFFIAR